MNAPSRRSQAIAYVVLTVIAAFMLLPFVWVFFGSFRAQSELVADPGAWIPRAFTLENYVALFDDKGFGVYLANSLMVATAVVIGNVLFGSMAGYALAKLRFRGRGLILPLVVVAMTVPYVALFVSQFVIVVQLGIVNTLAAIALPLMVTPLSVFIMRQFAYSLPIDLFEAGRLDGASEFRLFFGVFLPIAGPGLATVALLSFLAAWNDFLWPLVVAQSREVYTAPIGLAVASQTSKAVEVGILLAGAAVVLLPVLILFLVLQRYFIQGVATSGLK